MESRYASSSPSSWLPREAAMAHYAACDAMNLTDVSIKNPVFAEIVAFRQRGTRRGCVVSVSGKKWISFRLVPDTQLTPRENACPRVIVDGADVMAGRV